MGKVFNAILIACAVAISTAAQSDWVKIDPNSPLAEKAVSRARIKFEQSGLDTTGYSVTVRSLEHSILVTFYDPLTFKPYIDPPPLTAITRCSTSS